MQHDASHGALDLGGQLDQPLAERADLGVGAGRLVPRHNSAGRSTARPQSGVRGRAAWGRGRSVPAGAGTDQPDRQRAQVHAAGKPGRRDYPALGRKAESRVTDTGVGIAAVDLLPRIFDVLVQGRQAQAANRLGLRLTLVRRLVELHHGRVTASSDGAGRGAEFVLRLPLLVGRRGAMCSKLRPHRRRRRTSSGS